MLDDRKKRILQAIIDDYINTAEPVGSRTIEKKYKLGLSSATIRNEMADLEDLGYIRQPHTSAGRVPSLSGYRLYVDELMTQYSLTMEEISVLQSVMQEKVDFLEKIISKSSGALSQLTNCTSIVVGPQLKTDAIKSIRLISMADRIALAVIVTDDGLIKDKKIILTQVTTQEELSRLENAINVHITGIDFSDITVDKIICLVNDAQVSNELALGVFKFIEECINKCSENDVYINGQSNILGLPEFSDLEKAKKYMKFVSNRAGIMKVINEVGSKNNGINIQIGTNNESMENCSIITSRYKVGENMEGFIGLIGPVRMDYKKAVTVIKSVTEIINSKMKDTINKREVSDDEQEGTFKDGS